MITADSTVFLNNSGRYGGALYLHNSESPADDDIDDDSAGACHMSIANSSFILNGLGSSSYGGAIFMWATQLSIQSTLFKYNSVRCATLGRGGGAMWVHGNSLLSINTSRFLGNAGPEGGAIYVLGNSQCNIASTSFTANQAQNPAPITKVPTGSYRGVAENWNQTGETLIANLTFHNSSSLYIGVYDLIHDDTKLQGHVVCDHEDYYYGGHLGPPGDIVLPTEC
jgi:hypothetical protein